MGCRETHAAGLLLGANPDGAGAANHRERIVANQFGRALQVQLDGVVRKGPNRAELIGDAKNHARCIGAIGQASSGSTSKAWSMPLPENDLTMSCRSCI